LLRGRFVARPWSEGPSARPAKVLGGGSSINAQIYTRGNRRDYDAWAEEEDCRGWGYADVLPYFQRAEDNQRFADDYHGTEGPLGVSIPINPPPISEAFLRAAQQFGIPYNHDFNGKQQAGIGHYQVTVRNARRCSTAAAYLRPARDRRNLTVRTGATVARVIVERGRTVGVELLGANGNREQVRCEREVIVSSGAIGSPHLRTIGLDVMHDLPGVGGNLQDHLDLFVIAECTGEHTYDRYAKAYWAFWAGLQYLLFRRGPVASPLFETGGFWSADTDPQWPEIQFHLGLGSGIEAGVEKLRNAGLTLNSAYLRPQSRGTVRLASADPRAMPLIDPNYWSEPHDRAVSPAGLRMGRELLRQPALKPFILAERMPGRVRTAMTI
jgi:choline dehydrogenase-like flavoprotein